jgi:hypothetical protein
VLVTGADAAEPDAGETDLMRDWGGEVLRARRLAEPV